MLMYGKMQRDSVLSNGLGQGYAHFDSKLLGNGDRCVTLKLQPNWKSSMAFN